MVGTTTNYYYPPPAWIAVFELVEEKGLGVEELYLLRELVRKALILQSTSSLKVGAHTILPDQVVKTYFPARTYRRHPLIATLTWQLWSRVRYIWFKSGYFHDLGIDPEEWQEARAKALR
jgi:hypothetical protein